jgi:hypothetical protein
MNKETATYIDREVAIYRLQQKATLTAKILQEQQDLLAVQQDLLAVQRAEEALREQRARWAKLFRRGSIGLRRYAKSVPALFLLFMALGIANVVCFMVAFLSNPMPPAIFVALIFTGILIIVAIVATMVTAGVWCMSADDDRATLFTWFDHAQQLTQPDATTPLLVQTA